MPTVAVKPMQVAMTHCHWMGTSIRDWWIWNWRFHICITVSRKNSQTPPPVERETPSPHPSSLGVSILAPSALDPTAFFWQIEHCQLHLSCFYFEMEQHIGKSITLAQNADDWLVFLNLVYIRWQILRRHLLIAFYGNVVDAILQGNWTVRPLSYQNT